MSSPTSTSRYEEILREFDALSSSSSDDEIPILDREDYDDCDLPALCSSSSLSSNSSCFSFPSRSPHTGARWYDDHDFNPLSATSSISSPPNDLPLSSMSTSEEYLHDTHYTHCHCGHSHLAQSISSACSSPALSTTSLPPNPPPSLCGFPLDGMMGDGTTTARLMISDEALQKLQLNAWEHITGDGAGSPERKRRLQRMRKAGGVVHKKIEKMFKR
ncbi:hypothetical protein EX30DRAFT_51140 [Ascodesmis nigricans]|uniref:Uncharacterized protein n=1 Tax=Ascodesmis nigricans TaxID=341454 RepID=A0A4S2MVC0_9PEZI|nr:hypothetical protein EX30DRAFT_51140 [Ascodesmis nigricans]